MKVKGILFLPVCFMFIICFASFPLIGQTPFDSDSTVSANLKKTKSPGSDSQISPSEIDNLRTQSQQNQYSGEFGTKLLSPRVLRGNVKFTDDTKSVVRVPHFEKILGSHGCKVIQINKVKDKTKGGFLGIGKRAFLNVSASLEGKDFVIQKLVRHYGGSVGNEISKGSSTEGAEFSELVSAEQQSVKAEVAILEMELEIDKLLVEFNNQGTLSIGKKNEINKKIEGLRNSIVTKKSEIAGIQSSVQQGLFDLGVSALNANDFEKAISLFSFSGKEDNSMKFNMGLAYKGLKNYETAINYFSSINPTNNGILLNIAESQHLSGKSWDAIDSLLKILSVFQNSKEQVEALNKLDEWKYLQSSEFPGLPEKASKIYVEKAIIEGSTDDYKRGVSLKTNVESLQDASNKIVGEFQSKYSISQNDLAAARRKSSERFNAERSAAIANLQNSRREYDDAFLRAESEYRYELDSLDSKLRRARLKLADLESEYAKQRPSGNTDPYGGGSSGSSTDPYGSKKPNSSTDPYAKKPSTSGTTDPYGGGSSGSGTDPYGGTNTPTDPYSSGGGVTQADLDSARANVENLERSYRRFISEKDRFISERTSSAASKVKLAQENYQRYDPSKQNQYVEGSQDVVHQKAVVQVNKQRLTKVQGLARSSGY
ncbi:tetratricopeptide repeat protein [bacterium]|nr:tetratricopeptide repeat protein [bacterium]